MVPEVYRRPLVLVTQTVLRLLLSDLEFRLHVVVDGIRHDSDSENRNHVSHRSREAEKQQGSHYDLKQNYMGDQMNDNASEPPVALHKSAKPRQARA